MSSTPTSRRHWRKRSVQSSKVATRPIWRSSCRAAARRLCGRAEWREPELAAAELRHVLVQIGADAFLRVLAGEEPLLQLALQRQRLGQRDLASGLHRTLDVAHGAGGLGRGHEL